MKGNGKAHYRTISQRHAFYVATSYTLHRGEDIDARIRCIRFFDAAADVTHTFNVGAVDLWPALKNRVGLNSNVEALLNAVNAILFEKNFAVIRRLLIDWKRPVDPITGEGDLSSIAFDLRMVEIEQDAVQAYLDQKKPVAGTLKILNDDNDLADFVGQWVSGQGGIVSRRREFRKTWLPAVGISKFDFSRKADRVALGQAYVLFLHRHGLAEYKLFKQAGQMPSSNCGGTLPATASQAAQLPEAAMKRSLYVANALFESRRGKPDIPLLATIAVEGSSAGLAGPKLSAVLDDVRKVVRRKLEELEALGLQSTLDDSTLSSALMREAIATVAKQDKGLANRLEATSISWRTISDDMAERAGAASTRLVALETLFEKAQSDSSFAAAIATTITDPLGVSPNDPVLSFASKLPTFAGQPGVKVVLAALSSSTDGFVQLDRSAIEGIANSGIMPLNSATKSAIAVLASDSPVEDVGDLALAALGSAAGFDARKALVTARSLKDGVTIGNGDAAVYLASTAAGLFDPKLGRDIQQVGTIAVTILKVVNGYKDSVDLGPGAMGVGVSMMTGNYLGAALAIAGMMGGGSDPPDPAIELLTALREEVQEMRQEMHQRFDRVDRRLGGIYERLDTGLSQLQSSINGVTVDLAAVKDDLGKLRQEVVTLQTGTILEVRAASDDIRTALVADCVNWAAVAATAPIPLNNYVSCLGRIGDAATTVSPDTPQSITISPTIVAARANSAESRLARLPWLLSVAERLGYPLITPSERAQLVRPDRWAGAAAEYMQLARQWPDQWREAKLSHFRDTIIKPGQALRKAVADARAVLSDDTVVGAFDARQRGAVASWSDTLAVANAELNNRARQPSDTWNDEAGIKGCGDDIFPAIYLEDAPLTMPAGISWPVDLQPIRRTKAAVFRWCVAEVETSDVDAPAKVLLKGQVSMGPAGDRWATVAAWQLTGSKNVAHPKFVGPGVGINPGNFEPSYGDFVREQWPDLLAAETTRPARSARGSIDTYFRTLYEERNVIKQQSDRFAKVMTQAESSWLYDKLESQPPSGSKVDDGEMASTVLRELAFISAGREVEGNDVLLSLLGGAAPGLNSASLSLYRANFTAKDAIRVAGTRQAAALKLVKVAAQTAGTVEPGKLSDDADELLSRAELLLNEAIAECLTGDRPSASCDIDLRS